MIRISEIQQFSKFVETFLGNRFPFTVFSTFYMDKLGEIRRHHWKERLIDISKIAKFESDTS